jgi:hypothetical protein
MLSEIGSQMVNFSFNLLGSVLCVCLGVIAVSITARITASCLKEIGKTIIKMKKDRSE